MQIAETLVREPEDRLIVALDRGTTEGNLSLVRQLAGRARWFKVGMREYYAAGDEVIEAVRVAGARLFLDLKLHDIPATVAGAARALAGIEPELLTIHASGGGAMVESAVEAMAELSGGTRVLAVTVLTSMSAADLAVFGTTLAVQDVVVGLASMSFRHGAHGVVASAQEARAIREAVPRALIVTPGIRPAGAAHGDQARVLTPAAAIDAGADLLVVGRPIHQAAEPASAFDAIVSELRACDEGSGDA